MTNFLQVVGFDPLLIENTTPSTVPGPQGPAGPQGPTGPQGPAGTGGGTGEQEVYNVRTYGATGDGATDDVTAIQAAVTAAKATGKGGVVLFPPGTYLCSGVLNFDSTTNITIKGEGARTPFFANSQFGNPRTELRYTATGTATFISADQSDGFKIDGVAVRYSSTSYTGTLIKLTGTGTNPNYGASIKDATVGGVGTAVSAAVLVDLLGAVETDFYNVNFERGVVAVSGRRAGVAFSNAVTFTACHWAGCATAVLNPYTQWSFVNCVFEPNTMSQNGNVSVILAQDSYPISGVSFTGCGFWDATGGGPWIDVCGAGLTLTGCYWEPQGHTTEQLIRVRTSTTNPAFDGLSVTGLRGDGDPTNSNPGAASSTYATLLIWQQGNTSDTFTNLSLHANSYRQVKDGLDGLSGQVSFTGRSSSARLSDLGSVTTTATLTRSPAQRMILTSATCAVTMPTVAAGVRTTIELSVIQDGTGSRLITWDSRVAWAGGSAPTLATAASHMDVIRLSTDDGLIWVGSVVAANAPSANVPAAPVVTATAGNSSVSLTWAAPTNGGATITDYVVQYRTTAGPGAWNTFADGTSSVTGATVTSLTNATSYDFQVAAVNVIGQGPYSAPATATPTSGAAFNPLTAITWTAAYWASDPGWTPPADGAAVSSWRDGSGNSRTLTQATGSLQPIYHSSATNLNSKPVVQFDGVDDYMASPTFTQGQTFSVVAMLADVLGTAGGARVFGSNNTAGCQLWGANDGSWHAFAGTSNTFGADAASDGEYLIVVFNGSSSVTIDGTGSATAQALGTNTMTNGVVLGARDSSVGFGQGKFGFFGIYNGDIRSDANYASLRSWATSFYGLAN